MYIFIYTYTHRERIRDHPYQKLLNLHCTAFWKPHLVTQGKAHSRVSFNVLRTSLQMSPLNFIQTTAYIYTPRAT